MIENFRPFIISLAVGLLIGVERERSHPIGMHALGVRTFILFALLGTLAAQLNSIYLTTTLSLFVFGVILLGYFRSTGKKREGIGITTELAGGIVFCLGYLAFKEPLLACFLAACVLLILVERNRLHFFAREQLKFKEIKATVVILLISLGVLAFLPNHTIDPWGVINPRRLGIVVIILSLVQFGGYIAIRAIGERLGVMLTGFFGGLVSSTAVFAALPQFYKDHPRLLISIVAAAILANIAMLIEFMIVVVAAAPTLMSAIILPVSSMIVAGILPLIFMVKRKSDTDILPEEPGNPLDFKSLVRLSVFIASMLVIVALAERYLGTSAVQLITFLGGFFEIHSVSLATATLYAQQKLNLHATVLSLAGAVLASFLTKFILLLCLARNRFGLLTALLLLVMLSVGVVTFFLIF